jgi:hypothetical protein
MGGCAAAQHLYRKVPTMSAGDHCGLRNLVSVSHSWHYVRFHSR